MKNTTSTKKKIGNRRLNRNVFYLLLILLIVGVGSSVAYLFNKSTVQNEFIMGEVRTEVTENSNSDEIIKKGVAIKNIGNVPIYIRVTMTAFWKDNDGNILSERPIEGVDYFIKFSTSTNWVKASDGYYYFKNIVNSTKSTDVLIEECVQAQKYDDKTLEFRVINQAIQAEPAKAVKEAWGVNIINNQLEIKE